MNSAASGESKMYHKAGAAIIYELLFVPFNAPVNNIHYAIVKTEIVF